MRKSVFVIAVIAAACSSVAFAGEIKQDKKATAPAVKAQTMSDAQMDKVTAAGIGHAYAFGQGAGPGWLYNNGLGKNH
jgi:hypothetical protein